MTQHDTFFSVIYQFTFFTPFLYLNLSQNNDTKLSLIKTYISYDFNKFSTSAAIGFPFSDLCLMKQLEEITGSDLIIR